MLFTGLAKAMQAGEVATAMVTMCDDGSMRVTVLWDKDRDYGNDALKAPLLLTGLPSELDEAFVRELDGIGEVRRSLSEAAQVYTALLADAKIEVGSATNKALAAPSGSATPRRTSAALKTPQGQAVATGRSGGDEDFMDGTPGQGEATASGDTQNQAGTTAAPDAAVVGDNVQLF